MPCRHPRAAARFVFVLALGLGRIATADPIATSLYTPTDLGPNATISTDSNGNRILIATDGQRYAFPGASPVRDSATLLNQLGAPLPAYDNSGGPNTVTIDPTGGITNSHGVFVAATYKYGRYNDMISSSELYTFQQQSDGSFTPAQVLASQWQGAGFEHTNPMAPIDINKNGLVLLTRDMGSNRGFSLDDLKAGTITDLPIGFDPALYQTPAFRGLSLDAAVKLDDDGRILFNSDRMVNGQTVDGLVLMTPAGVSSDPLPAPEPSTLLVLGVAAAGWLARRPKPRSARHSGTAGVQDGHPARAFWPHPERIDS